MYELALFAGAGGGILGGHLLGWECVGAVEIESYPRSVLLARQRDGCLPWFPIWDDIKTFRSDNHACGEYFEFLRSIRSKLVISGGFPCQRFSSAARGRNNAENLWGEYSRVVGEVRPAWVFSENVKFEAIDQACDDLEAMGYKAKAIPLGAHDLGADHVRERFWLAAYSNDQGELLRTVDAEVAGCQKFRHSVWEAEPWNTRMDDGVARKVDRYKATGNGQVPIVAATAWRILTTIGER